ncbi:conserved unknown protein [Ectocarpus siliculosus]|uniref:Uncharacterized protein n=1 Tax=Ectocarpus siliculosus TaxID=2880 RepID=D7FSY0_ECTSI|nr:conserved unknown protein [Ectocarpus siliculosus]|eukprot:CBJ31271.1 conserved unknown protein [Ectocarpus siliculosus]
MSFGAMNAGKADYALPSAPSDGVSDITFSPTGNLITAGSWDNGVRVWELQRGYGTQPITAVPKAQINHDAPVLCTDFSADGTKVFSGGASKQVNMWSLGQPGTTGQQIGVHDAAVKTVRFIPEMNLVASASWDRTVKFWDTRTSTPAAVVTLCERAYSMDTKGAMMVVATADRKICVYNLGSWTTNGPAPQTMTDSPLRYQTRCVSIFPDQQGFAVGSIEGRVGIEYFSEQAAKQQAASGYKPATTYGNTKLSFAFKCHRVAGAQSSVYSVNSIAFHKYGTFATAGSDGNFHFWDKDSRQRLKAYDLKQGNTISVCKFSPDGGLFGYAMSYDWSQGVEHANPQATNNIFVHAVADDEIKPRPKDKK